MNSEIIYNLYNMEKYNQKLPKEVEQKLDAYVERIKAIKWFKPEPKLEKKKIEKQVKIALDCFGVKAKIEYRKLETPKDWGAARGAAWGAAWGAARCAAWGAADLLALELDDYKKKYPNGNFIQLIPLWELGLYPVGVVDGSFVIYLPPVKSDFPEIK